MLVLVEIDNVNFKLHLGERLKAMLEKAKKIQQETREVFTAVEAKHDGICCK